MPPLRASSPGPLAHTLPPGHRAAADDDQPSTQYEPQVRLTGEGAARLGRMAGSSAAAFSVLARRLTKWACQAAATAFRLYSFSVPLD
jgi:hypothetical protein